jgi:uncharacterized protein (TIGR03643 family)
MSKPLTAADVSEIIAMAWDDETAFDAIERLFGIGEGDVIKLMRREMKASSFRMWRKRVSGRAAKHEKSKKQI